MESSVGMGVFVAWGVIVAVVSIDLKLRYDASKRSRKAKEALSL